MKAEIEELYLIKTLHHIKLSGTEGEEHRLVQMMLRNQLRNGDQNSYQAKEDQKEINMN